MKLFTGWVLAAGLVFAGSAADAQMLSPYSRVSDFGGPYSEAPYGRPYSEAPYRGGPYYATPPQEAPVYAAPPQEAPLPPRYGNGYGPALLPPHEVYNIIREAGFSPLGIPQQRGYVYTIAVIDRGGGDGKLVIDGRSGQIIRFVPAWRMGGHFNDTLNMTHGPAGMPPQVTQVRGSPRPPASVPHVASRTVPVPKASPLARPAVAEPAPTKSVEPPQQSAAAQAKPAEASPPPVATATIGQAKPAAPAMLPTQDMPKAQGLD